MKLKTILLTTLLLATISLKAQYWDYVVTTRGDTIKCIINKSRTRYKAADMKRFKDINFDEISAYYSTETSALYRAIVKPYENDEDTVFMPVLEKGRINLYELTEYADHYDPFLHITTRTQSVTHYLSKESGPVEIIKTNFWGSGARKEPNNTFAEMIKDNKSVYDKFLAGDNFGFEQLRDLVRLYNITSGPYKEIFKPRKKINTPVDFNPGEN